MARYIDADNLVERLKVSPIFQDFGTDGYFIRDMVIDLVGCRPTADVVPKSEVDIWKQNRFNLYQRLELYETARKKVAREIFEEIEKIATAEGAYDYVSIQEIAELKKKYTEDERHEEIH